MLRTHYAGELKETEIGKIVRIAGWVEDLRLLGSLLFLTVRDVTGKAQVVFSRKGTENGLFSRAKNVPRQSSIVVGGLVQESRARDLRVEIKGDYLLVLSEATHPLPVDPTGRVPASIDLRLDSRAIDLRNPRTAALFKIRHKVLQSMRNVLTSMGFTEVNTSRIIGQAAEGGANLFSLDYFGGKAYLAQSPQLYKEQLTLALDRVFEIGNFFRAEKSSTRKHLSEFVSVDIEAAYADEHDVMQVAEDLMVRVFKEVREDCDDELKLLRHKVQSPNSPFQRLSYADAVEQLKKEGVDIDYGQDLTDSMLRILGRLHRGFYWIVDWPSSLKPFYIEVRDDKPEISRGFDLQYGYLEIASGGMRVSSKPVLTLRLKESGLDSKEFADHLKAFDWGMPVHSGWAIGLDRLMMVLTGRTNIRDVVLYPRDRYRLRP